MSYNLKCCDDKPFNFNSNFNFFFDFANNMRRNNKLFVNDDVMPDLKAKLEKFKF